MLALTLQNKWCSKIKILKLNLTVGIWVRNLSSFIGYNIRGGQTQSKKGRWVYSDYNFREEKLLTSKLDKYGASQSAWDLIPKQNRNKRRVSMSGFRFSQSNFSSNFETKLKHINSQHLSGQSKFYVYLNSSKSTKTKSYFSSWSGKGVIFKDTIANTA